jgi:ABC-2 type transport system ATP-binding protein
MSPENLIEVRNLRKEFGNRVAVKDISFTVQRGEILGLLGPNGAGKTTTIHMLLGLTVPSTGSIEIFDQSLQQHRVEILSRMNFASAYQSLPYNLTVWENLYIFSEIYGVSNARRKILDLLVLFELEDFARQRTGRLSSGEQTRVGLCKALLSEPEILLLDEPTASLDPDHADKVRKILLSQQEETGMTIINTSHNMIDVDELCDRILFINNGEVVASGEGHHLMKQFGGESLEDVFIKIARGSSISK